MAKSKEVHGGVVNLSDIINQITSVTEDLAGIIDAINANCDYASINKKADQASKNVHNLMHIMTDLFTYIQESLANLKELNDGDSAKNLQSILTGYDPSADITKTDFSKAGILQLLIGIFKMIENIINMEVPSQISLMWKMTMLKLNVDILAIGILGLTSSAGTMAAILNSGARKLILTSINNMVNMVMTLATKMHDFVAIDTPNSVVMLYKTIVLYLDLKILAEFINRLNNYAQKNIQLTIIKQFITSTSTVISALRSFTESVNQFMKLDVPTAISIRRRMRRLSRITRILIAGLNEIAKTISINFNKKRRDKLMMSVLNMTVMFALLKIAIKQIAITVAVISVIGMLVLLLFIPFILGLASIVVAFGIMVKMIRLMAKLARRAAFQAIKVVVPMIVVCGVLMIIATTLMMIVLAGKVLQDNLLSTLITIGFMGLIVLAIAGFMTLASFVAPFMLIGVIAMAAITIGILALLALATMLIMIVWIAKFLDVDAVIISVDKIINTAEQVIQTVLNADFKRTKEDTDRSWIRTILGTVLGQEALGIFDLIVKVTILFLTVFVVITLIVLVGVIIGLTKIYEANKSILDNAPTVVVSIIEGAYRIIDTVINYKPNAEMGEEDDKFSKLISYVSGSDFVTIFKLLTKVVVVALSIVVLAMLAVLVKEMKWMVETTDGLDFNMVETRVGEIMKAVGNIIGILSEPIEEPNGKPRKGLSKLLQTIGLGNLADIVDLLCAFVRIGISVAALSVVLAAANIMKTCWETYNEMGGEKIGTNAATMTNGLLVGLDSIITTLNDSKVKLGDVDGGLDSLQATIPLFTTIMNITKLMKKAVDELQGIDDANLQKIDITCKKISESFNKLLNGEEGLLPFVVEHSQSYSAVVKDTDKLINRINGLNINKLDSLAKMFGHAAAFAQAINGNFDKLADVINEKLAPILEGLRKTIDDADQHIQEYTERQEQVTQRTGEAFEKLANAPTTGGPVPPGGANPTLQGAGQNKDVQAAAQIDISSQIESALRNFFRTNDGKILVSTT